MMIPKKIDLHMHSTVSDGSNTPEELLDCVRQAGLELFALTDHDAYKGSLQMIDLLREGDPGFITGVEFSCRDSLGQYHILGYGYDPESAPIRRVVDDGHRVRMEKVHARLDFLRDRFGFCFPQEELKKLLSLDNPGKPHIGNLMVKYGYARDKNQAIKEFIDQLHLKDQYLSPEEAIRGILASGGIPVLAHPVYGSGDQLILGEEMEERLRRLMGFGLQGVEAYYSGFTRKLRSMMLDLAQRYDLYVTAGSDYHGANKLIPLGDTGLEDASEGPEGLQRFLREVHRAK